MFDSRPTVAWTPTTVAWPFSDFFQKNFKLLETYKKRCLTVGRRSRDLRPLSRDRSVTFFKKISNCLKRSENVVWQSADGRVTSGPLSRDRSVTFFKKISNILKRPKNVVWQSADGRVTSDYCRVTVQWLFSKKISNCLNCTKNVVWQSADGRVTSDHCRVNVQWLFSKKFQIAWNVR